MNNFEYEIDEQEIHIETENVILNGLSIGTVETGKEADASITGNSPNQKLNLVLPRGEQGPQGIQGPQGEKGETGDVGPQGPAGQDGADGTNGTDGVDGITPHIGDNGNWFLGEEDTGKPSRGEQGPQGIQGPQGETGPTGPSGVSITTITTGTPTQEDGFTVTPLTINKSDSSSTTVNISAKNGLDGSQGTINYNELTNKPQINSVELSGNKSLSDLGIQQTVISETQPTDPSVDVWIDPSGDSITIPTKTSDLTNDSNFATETYVTNAISTAIGDALGGSY